MSIFSICMAITIKMLTWELNLLCFYEVCYLAESIGLLLVWRGFVVRLSAKGSYPVWMLLFGLLLFDGPGFLLIRVMLSSTLLVSPTETFQLKIFYTPTELFSNTTQFSKYAKNIPSHQASIKPKFKHFKLLKYFCYHWQRLFTYIF